MKFSWGWICDYLEPVSNALERIPQVLLQAGIEIANIIDMSRFAGFEIVEIIDIEKHPNADSLNICTLRGKTGQVVCGASNIYTGMRCVLANDSAVIPSTNTVLVSKAIRGIMSHGMLCSGAELNLGTDSDGLLDVKNETSIDKILLPNGPIFDVEITPNRGDLLSIYGIARELSAFGLGKLKSPRLNSLQLHFEETSNIINVKTDKVLSMYSLSLSNLHNNITPDWMVRRLKEVDLKSHSLAIDVTNYISHALGQPLHAFDGDIIKKIDVIDISKTTFTDLKGITHEINDDLCVMMSSGIPVSVPGVIGGDIGKCTENTHNVLLEAGNYSSDYISKAQQSVCITNASRKFLQGIDPNISRIAILEAGALLEKISGCSFGIATASKVTSIEGQVLNITESDMKSLNISLEIADSSLHDLGFIKKNGSGYTVPSWRYNINTSEDLLEEVLRKVGYESIPEDRFCIHQKYARVNSIDNQIRNMLSYAGLYEVLTKDFISENIAKLFKVDKKLQIRNPISSAQFGLKSHILLNLYEIGDAYARHNWQAQGIYEISDVFIVNNNEIIQSKQFGIAFAMRQNTNWLQNNHKLEYFYRKEVFERVLSYIYGPDLDCILAEDSELQNSSRWLLKNTVVAEFGQVSERFIGALKLKFPLTVGWIQISNTESNQRSAKYTSENEVITRDLSVLIPPNFQIGNLIDIIRQNTIGIQVKIFDIYPDPLLDINSRSVGIRLIWDNLQKTLTNHELNEQLLNIQSLLVSMNCSVRQS